LPVALIQEFPIDGDDRSTTNYDAVSSHVMATGVPEGLVSHSAGFDEAAGVFRIFDIWETQAHAQRFLDETITPFIQGRMGSGESAPPPPAREGFYDLHNVVAR
jgi:hypothetical protein